MKTIDLNDSPALPESSESISGGTNGAVDGASTADLQRGFTKIPAPEQTNDSGENSVGNPYDRGGFLNRPQGWER